MAEPAASTLDASGVREAVRDLILVLADSKRLLGMRYAEWILGAPELEAGIACASMAQDEWGHARLLYALLRDFDEDVDRLEHGRGGDEYRSMEALDRAPGDWPALVAVNVLADAALTVQLESLRDSGYAPLRQRVEKMLDEERFHEAHGAAWFRRLAAGGAAARQALGDGVSQVLPDVLHWFGPDSGRADLLTGGGIVDAAGRGLRQRFLERVGDTLGTLGDVERWRDEALDFTNYDEATRRRRGGGPDEATLAKVRGDRNRAFLME